MAESHLCEKVVVAGTVRGRLMVSPHVESPHRCQRDMYMVISFSCVCGKLSKVSVRGIPDVCEIGTVVATHPKKTNQVCRLHGNKSMQSS